MIESVDPDLRAVCRRLSGEPVIISTSAIDLARRNHLQFLLASRLTRSELVETRLTVDLRGGVALMALRDTILCNLLQHLADARIDALLIKGAALAHTVYALSYQRPRTDVDVFVRAGDIDRADRVLLDAGWTRAIESSGTAITAQRHYDRTVAGVTEHLDLHWRIANAAVFADAIEFDAALARSLAVPALGPSARALGTSDALLLACLHRVAHHYNGGPLIWLWDIHALAAALDEDATALFLELTRTHRMRAVCIHGLARAAECFGTPSASQLIAALEADRPAEEPSAAFLSAERLIQVVTSDLRHASTWPARVRIVQEHLFPAAGYMRGRYPNWPKPLLPLAYAYRIARGAPAWFRSRKH